MANMKFVFYTTELIQQAIADGDLNKAKSLALALEGDLGSRQKAIDLFEQIKSDFGRRSISS